MANVIPFPGPPPAKFGFQRAERRTRKRFDPDQLDLFSSGASGKVLRFPRRIGRFEEALLLDEREHPKAADAYRTAISEGDRVADAYCNLGILESRKGRTAKAFDCFTKSLKTDPRHFETHYNLANQYFETGDLALARVHYEIAGEIDPGFSNTHFNLGLVHALNEAYDLAIDAFTSYRDTAPEDEVDKVVELLGELKRTLATRG